VRWILSNQPRKSRPLLPALSSLPATIAAQRPPNLRIVVLDNECYGETGQQRTHREATPTTPRPRPGRRVVPPLSSYRLPQLTESNAHYYALTQSGPLASHQHSRARQLWVMTQAMIVPSTPLKREMALPENDCF
jgi:hypothetical protein